MKPLFVLLIVFVISIFIIKLKDGAYDFALAARIAMSAMLIFTAIGHFKFTEGMAMMLPPIVPDKVAIIYLTGILEIAAAVGLLLPQYKSLTGWFLIIFFILLLPANIYAAVKHIDYEKATLNGSGLGYLWFRVPLQILFIVWVYLSAIKY